MLRAGGTTELTLGARARAESREKHARVAHEGPSCGIATGAARRGACSLRRAGRAHSSFPHGSSRSLAVVLLRHDEHGSRHRSATYRRGRRVTGAVFGDVIAAFASDECVQAPDELVPSSPAGRGASRGGRTSTYSSFPADDAPREGNRGRGTSDCYSSAAAARPRGGRGGRTPSACMRAGSAGPATVPGGCSYQLAGSVPSGCSRTFRTVNMPPMSM